MLSTIIEMHISSPINIQMSAPLHKEKLHSYKQNWK